MLLAFSPLHLLVVYKPCFSPKLQRYEKTPVGKTKKTSYTWRLPCTVHTTSIFTAWLAFAITMGKNICFLGSWFGWWWYFAAHKTVSFPYSLQIFKGIVTKHPITTACHGWWVTDRQIDSMWHSQRLQFNAHSCWPLLTQSSNWLGCHSWFNSWHLALQLLSLQWCRQSLKDVTNV